MLHPKVKRNFEASLENQSFLNDIKHADNDNPFDFDLSDPIKQTIIASIYYGWLVAKYGKNWQNHIDDKN